MKTVTNLESALQTIEATEMGTPHHNMADMGMDFVMERAYVRDTVSTEASQARAAQHADKCNKARYNRMLGRMESREALQRMFADLFPETYPDVPSITNIGAVLYGAKPIYEDK